MAEVKGIDYFNDKVPNEITIMILSHLQKQDLKGVRFACKKLAALAGRMLVVNLYLSPREKDMEVFDAVTQHPDLKMSVKNIIYDSARFVKYTFPEYLEAYAEKFKLGQSAGLSWAEAMIQEMGGVMEKILEDESPVFRRSTAISHLGLEQLLRHSVLIQGYQCYTFHAQEQGNIFLSSWYSRAFEGLRRLGQIRCATICNSWEMIPRTSCDPTQIEGNDCESSEDDEDLEKIRGTNVEDFFDAMSGSTTKMVPRMRVRPDGTRLVRSPSARAWLPSVLQPEGPKSFASNSISDILTTGKSNGSFEFTKFTKLLSTTGKLPLKFEAGWCYKVDWTAGVPLDVFNKKRSPESVTFASLANRLQILDVTFAHLDQERCPDLDIFKEFLHQARSLRSLRLFLTNHKDGLLISMTQIFPPLTELVLPSLTTLELHFLSFSYRELACLLFLSLPKLTSLDLKTIRILGGKWEDIIEGLRCFKELHRCYFNEHLLQDEGAYNHFDHESFGVRVEARPLLVRATEEYVLKRFNRHPNLNPGEPASASAKYLARLNETLKELGAKRA